MEMADYAQLMPRLLPQLVPAPQFAVLDALQTVSVDFFTRSEVWRETLQESVFWGDTEIPLALSRMGRAIVRVHELWLDGEKQAPGVHYTAEGTSVTLSSSAPRSMDVAIMASIRPTRTATKMPITLMEEWGDTLAFGTLAKVKSMTGPRVDWTDAAGAQLNMSLYEQGLAQARIRQTRGRDTRPLRIY